MSETPSLYDLTQDALIGPMRDILLTAAEPPSGAEYSYPVTGQALNTDMWHWSMLAMGSGILDTGGGPYRLRDLNNATNTAVLRVSELTGDANAVIRGFLHKLTANKTLTFPMPSAGTVTYHVCLTFDPREESSQQGPISVQVYTGTPPTTFGRHHITTHTVRRSANQLLTDATVQEHRPRVSPVSFYGSVDQLPKPTEVLWGELAVIASTGHIWVATGPATGEIAWWENLSAPKPTPITPHPWNKHAAGAPLQGVLVGGIVHLAGRVERTSGERYYTRAEGWPVGTLPVELRPPSWRRFVVGLSDQGGSRVGVGRLDIQANGVMDIKVDATTNFLSIDGVSFPAAGITHTTQ